MRAHFGLPSVRSGQSPFLPITCLSDKDMTDDVDELDKRAPISVKFEIPYFTVSGIQVRYLKVVEKSGYQAVSPLFPVTCPLVTAHSADSVAALGPIYYAKR